MYISLAHLSIECVAARIVIGTFDSSQPPQECSYDVCFPAESGTAGRADAEEVTKLPPLVLQALAHALDYLKPFGLETVLRMGANFREFSSAHEMSLSPNALRLVNMGSS